MQSLSTIIRPQGFLARSKSMGEPSFANQRNQGRDGQNTDRNTVSPQFCPRLEGSCACKLKLKSSPKCRFNGNQTKKDVIWLPVKVDRDKVSRAYAVTPLCEAGRVYLPKDAPWLADFIDEHCNFPAARFDDTVDTTTQALNFLRGSGPPGIFLLHQEWAAEKEQTNV